MIVLILLKFSSTSTITGFQDLFAGKEAVFLAFSALWSNLSIVLGYMNAIIIQKNQLMPVLGKLLIALLSFTSLFGRVLAIIVFFSPSLGLMNLLMHWKMGNIAVQLGTSQELIYDISATTGETISFEKMWKPLEDPSELTILSLGTYFKIFLGFIVLHFLVMFAVKLAYAHGYRKKLQRPLTLFLHILIQVSFSHH